MSDAASRAALAGRYALVTGGAHGIGAAIARRFVAAGATVLVADLEQAEDGATTVTADLAEPDGVQAVVAAAGLLERPVDILVNCAGISDANPLLDLDPARYHRLLAINLHSAVMLMHALTPAMVRQGFGRIVNITSVHAQLSEPGCLAYDVAKAGLTAATRTAAIELAALGVLVNAVAPGFVSTRMSIVDGADELESDWFKTVYLKHGQLPIGRPCSPDEVAGVVLWLASDDNTYITGQTVTVDGGLTSRL